MKGVRMSNIQLYKIIVRCEQRDGPPQPSAHHGTGRLKKIVQGQISSSHRDFLTNAMYHYRGTIKSNKHTMMILRKEVTTHR